MNKKKAGWSRKTYEVRDADYNRGVGDAQTGSTNASRPPLGVDRRSWMLGYVSALACMDPTGSRDGKETGPVFRNGPTVLVAREDRRDGTRPAFDGPLPLGDREFLAAFWDNGAKGLGLALSERNGAGGVRKAGGGILPPNDKAGNDRRPDYKGRIPVDGIPVLFSVWKKTAADGKSRLSIETSPVREKAPGPGTEP